LSIALQAPFILHPLFHNFVTYFLHKVSAILIISHGFGWEKSTIRLKDFRLLPWCSCLCCYGILCSVVWSRVEDYSTFENGPAAYPKSNWQPANVAYHPWRMETYCEII